MRVCVCACVRVSKNVLCNYSGLILSTLECMLNSLECETKVSPFISRRNCVIVHGRPASDDTEHALIDLFGRTLIVPVGRDDIVRCHRLGASVNDTKPCEFSFSIKQKQQETSQQHGLLTIESSACLPMAKK